MAELACARISSLPCPQVLIGGLGMGFTLAAALNRLGAESRVVVAELVPVVVAWNRGPLAALAGNPLADNRVTVREVDVAQILQAEHRAYDAILLDVDNGPRGLTRKRNGWLYTRTGDSRLMRSASGREVPAEEDTTRFGSPHALPDLNTEESLYTVQRISTGPRLN